MGSADRVVQRNIVRAVALYAALIAIAWVCYVSDSVGPVRLTEEGR